MNLFRSRLVAAGLVTFVGGLFSSGVVLAADAPTSNQNSDQTTGITAQELNQNPATYLGKQVTLTGRVDRDLGNGSYIISDAKSTKDPSRRVLIFTSAPNNNNQDTKQEAGIAAPRLKEGDSVKLNGKVEEFNVSSEVDSFSPKSDVETIHTAAVTTPVVVVQPGSIARN
jgi:hypothetical protein